MPPLPILIQVVHHPSSVPAARIAEHLRSALSEDPAVPGLRIPVYFTPEDGTGLPPNDGDLEAEAERVLVLVLAEDHLNVEASSVGDARRSWADYLVALHAACERDPRHRFLPVQLTAAAWPLDSRFDDVNFLRAFAFADPAEQERFVVRRTVHALFRQLQAEPEEGHATAPVTLFVSHTKVNLDAPPRVVYSILHHLTADQPVKLWFDSGDIEAGSVFAEKIEKGVQNAVLLVVLTDAYASREWCRKEILFAKKHRRPFVVVNALQEREVRGFPYAGNAPVLRWSGDPDTAIDLLLKEALRHLHAQKSLEARSRAGDVVLPSPAELVTIVNLPSGSVVLYPDPPLGEEERALTSAAGIEVVTPLERFAREVEKVKLPLPVALSLSGCDDTRRYGLNPGHLDTACVEISRYLLLAGATLAYAGHLGAGGYTEVLFELVRSHALPGVPAPERVVNHIAWPLPLSLEDRSRFKHVATFVRMGRPLGVDTALHRDFVDEPVAFDAEASGMHRYAYARGITAMRQAQTEATCARIVLGGRMGPARNAVPDGTRKRQWYSGRIPGVLEEVLASLLVSQPLFLLGGFGGCARLVADVIEGLPRSEMSWDFQQHAPHASDMRTLYESHGDWVDYPELSELIENKGYASFNNGLSDEENRELAKTRNVERIVELILKGLRHVAAPPAPASRMKADH